MPRPYQFTAYVDRVTGPNTFLAGIKGVRVEVVEYSIATWSSRIVTINGLSPDSTFNLSSLLTPGLHVKLTRIVAAGDTLDRWCCDVEMPDGESLLDSIP